MSLTNYPNGITSFGVPIFGEMDFMGGNVYFVKKSTDTDYGDFCKQMKTSFSDGTQNIHTTADAAFGSAGKNDTIIFMAPDSGGHDLTETITLSSTHFGLRVFGMGKSAYTQRTMLKLPTTATDTEMFLIKTDKVEFAGLNLQNRKAGACVQIGDTAGQAYYQTYFHDCNFTDYGGVALYGITPGAVAGAANDQADPVNLVVENCVFDGFVTAAICVNGTRSAYINNHIYVAATAAGIKLYSGTDSRGKIVVKGNYMYGPADATTIGILASTTDHAVCWANITDNKFVGFTAPTQPITKMAALQGGGNLYAAAADGTWTAIDIVT